MHIHLLPFLPCEETAFALVRSGDTLTINGEAFDFSVLADGDTLPVRPLDSPPVDAIGCEFIQQDVERIDGVVHIHLRFPIGYGATAAAKNPSPIIDPPDGPIALPE